MALARIGQTPLAEDSSCAFRGRVHSCWALLLMIVVGVGVGVGWVGIVVVGVVELVVVVVEWFRNRMAR